MNCEEFVGCLSDYIDGALDPPRRAEVETHLASCHGCHVVLDTTQCAILLYRTAHSETLPPARRQELRQRIEAVCCGKRRSAP